MPQRVVALLSDLMFTVKIQDAAKRAGLEPVFVKSQDRALAEARKVPAGIIVDLNDSAAEPLALLAALKGSDDTRGVPVIGYVSHVQVDLRRAAQEKGCDVVVARSAFVQNLPGILRDLTERSTTLAD